MEIVDTVRKRVCKNALYKIFVNMLFSCSKREFIANCENIRWNHIMAEIFMFQ